MNDEFERFCSVVGGPAAAAKILDLSEIQINKMRARDRNVQRDTAKKIILGYPGINLHKLLYPELHD